MKSRITKTVALAALMAGASGVANATEGWYGRLDAGYSFDGKLDIESTLATFGGEGSLENDWLQSAGLGYAHSNNVRLEGEVSHRFNQLEPTATIDGAGDVHTWAVMLNAYYDFNRGGVFDPYIGAGIGAARVFASARDNTGVGGRFNEYSDALAYQLMAGVGLQVTESMSLDVGYRYFVAPDLEFDGLPVANSPYQADYDHHAVTLGLRWQFAQPEPPPPPPPPPPAAAPAASASAGRDVPDVGIRRVLRVGSLEPQPSRARHDRLGGQPRPSVQRRWRGGGRPHRHVRLAAVQPRPVGASRFGRS